MLYLLQCYGIFKELNLSNVMKTTVDIFMDEDTLEDVWLFTVLAESEKDKEQLLQEINSTLALVSYCPDGSLIQFRMDMCDIRKGKKPSPYPCSSSRKEP